MDPNMDDTKLSARAEPVEARVRANMLRQAQDERERAARRNVLARRREDTKGGVRPCSFAASRLRAFARILEDGIALGGMAQCL
ncbi:hypothetical protein CHN51_00950 [Sphingorhabdus sp. YGSMI21]|nr:hypothetical protein CHN51_00950 [Sphingorhabdus sp. YGSMI21]